MAKCIHLRGSSTHIIDQKLGKGTPNLHTIGIQTWLYMHSKL